MSNFLQGGESDSGGGGATQLSVTLPGVGAGHLLLAHIQIASGTPTPAISGGGTWTQAFLDRNWGTLGNTFAVWYSTNATGGSTTVTISGLASNQCNMSLTEWTGSWSLDVNATVVNSSTGGAGTITSNSVSPAASGDMMVSICLDEIGGVAAINTAGTNYALAYSKSTGDGAWIGYEERDAAPSGAQTASWTTPASGEFYSIALLGFSSSGGGTTPSSSDSATLTDTANKVAVNGPADSASQTDTTAIATGSSDAASLAEQNAIALLNSDAAAFAEQVAITVTAASSDSAALTDSASANAGLVNKSDTDTAALAEQIKLALTATDSAQLGEAMAIALARTDTATLQELVSVAIAIADVASLTEGATVSAHTSATDTATLSGESGSVTQQGNNPTASDAATLADTASTTAAVSTSDIGALAEQAAVKLGAGDVAAMTEHIGLALVAADNAALTEQLHLAVANAASDTAALGELQNAVAAVLAAAETAALSDTAHVTQNGVSSTSLKTFTLQLRSARFTLGPRGITFTLAKSSLTFTLAKP